MTAPSFTGPEVATEDASRPIPAALLSMQSLPDIGSPFRIRRARKSDRSALIEMLSRCTRETRLRRFHGNVHVFPEPYFTEALEGMASHVALVVDVDGRIAALASCRAVDDHAAELAVLVEDAYQRQGMGSDLLRTLVDHAKRSGQRTLKAAVMADQQWILRALSAYGQCHVTAGFGVFDATLCREQLRVGTPTAGVPGVRSGRSRSVPINSMNHRRDK